MKIESFAEPPESIAQYEKLRCDELGQGFVKLKNVRPYKNARRLLASILGCENREQAVALQGAELYVLQQDLQPLEENLFYHRTLIGLPVLDKNGEVLGEVIAIHNFGAGDLLDVQPKNKQLEKPKERVFIPFTHESVPKVSANAIEVCGIYADNLANLLAKKQDTAR